MENNRPEKSFWNKGSEVAIWKNENGGYKLKIVKTYKDKEGKKKETNYWFDNELVNLRTSLNEALDFMKEGGNKAE